MVTFTLNGQTRQVDVSADTPLLWVIRDTVKLTGTKFGCGMGLCGACTVHLNGAPARSCTTPIGTVEGAEVTTIEGLSPEGVHPVQRAWVEEQVPQCGYCQSGQIMSAAGLLADIENPTDEDIDRVMAGNVCRCGAYNAIRRAIHRAAELSRETVLVADDGAGQGGDR